MQTVTKQLANLTGEGEAGNQGRHLKEEAGTGKGAGWVWRLRLGIIGGKGVLQALSVCRACPPCSTQPSLGQHTCSANAWVIASKRILFLQRENGQTPFFHNFCP